ncbi:hypothetical protein OUZ56_026274 [Daphnia magna]|uniref:Uncharacterized protein n=1 Tax=Daphnia magna TaxID=35525 RepID=A0ABQ9ZLD2_9CRUS|nr:hypothetical protein OUZ56_026274 [Daphnia magna]
METPVEGERNDFPYGYREGYRSITGREHHQQLRPSIPGSGARRNQTTVQVPGFPPPPFFQACQPSAPLPSQPATRDVRSRPGIQPSPRKSKTLAAATPVEPDKAQQSLDIALAQNGEKQSQEPLAIAR